MFKKLTIVALIMVLALSIACQPTAKNPSGPAIAERPTDAGTGILRNSSSTAASTINPHDAGTTYDKEILSLAQALLYDLFPDDAGMNAVLKGELADGPPVQMDSNGQVWQIKVKENAKWANGEPLTVDDIIYSWQMLLDPKLLNQYGGTFAKNFITIKNASAYFSQGKTGTPIDWEQVGIKKVGNNVIEINTTESNTAWEVMNHFNLVASAPVYKPYYEKYMDASRTNTLYGTDKDKFMSSGAFVLDEWVKGSIRKYSKNPHYVYKDLIWLAGMETQIVSDGGTRLQMFESGELHYVGLAEADAVKYVEDPRLQASPALTVRHIEINMQHPTQPILGNLNFRKALYYAMDRERYARITGMIPAAYVMSSRKIADLDNGIPFRDFDIAKSYLPEKHGYNPSLAKQLFDTALQEEGLDKVSLTLNYYETRPDTRVVSELMQKDLAAIFGQGKFELSLRQLPNTQLFNTMREFTSNPSSFELSWAGWGHSATEFAPWRSFVVYTSSYDRKNAPIFDPELDRIYDEVSSEAVRHDLNRTNELTAQLEKYVIEHVYEIPIYEHVNQSLISDKVLLQTKRWMSGVGFGFKYARIGQ